MKKNKQQDFSFHHLIRGTILIGMTLLLFKLMLTNNISLLIAPKMIKFIYFTFIVLFILGILLIIRGTSSQNQHFHCDCEGEHSYPTSFFKGLFLYLLFIIPISTGFLFENNVLNSSVAMNRPINLGASSLTANQYAAAKNSISKKSEKNKSAAKTNQNSSTAKTQNVLDYQPEPLTESEYTKLQTKMLKTNNIMFSDNLYVPMLNAIQDNLSKMIGKTVTTKGFVYREKNFFQDQIIVARFGITCCVADASVYGFMAKGNVAALPKDKWVQVTGTIGQTQYNGSTVPLIKIKKISKISAPSQPYVFDVGIQLE